MIKSGEIQIQLVVADIPLKNDDKYQHQNLQIVFDEDVIETNGLIWINKI